MRKNFLLPNGFTPVKFFFFISTLILSLPRVEAGSWSGPETKVISSDEIHSGLLINGVPISPIFLMLNAQTVEVQNHDWAVFDYEISLAEAAGVKLVEINLLENSDSFVHELSDHLKNKNIYYIIRYNLYKPLGYSGQPMKYYDTDSGKAMNHPVFLTASESYVQAQVAETQRVLTLIDRYLPGRVAGVKFTNYETGENFFYPMSGKGEGPGSGGLFPWKDNFYYPDYSDDFAFNFCQWSLLPLEAKSGCSLPLPSLRSKPTLGNILITGETPESLRSIYMSRFASRRVTDGMKKIAKSIKVATSGKALTSAFYGYTYAVYWNLSSSGHLDARELLKDSSMDSISAPYSYLDSRNLGRPLVPEGPDAPPGLRSKLYFYEDDTHTHIEALLCGGVPNCSPYEGPELVKALTLVDSQKFIRRNALFSALRGTSIYFMDLFGRGWSGNPKFPADSKAIWKTIAEARREIDQVQQAPKSADLGYRPQIAVFTDELSGSHFPLSGFGGPNTWDFSNLFASGAILELSSLGAPIKRYLLSDILEPSFPDAQIRLAIFLNAFHMTSEIRSAVATKLKRDGKTLLYVYAPAVIDDTEKANPSQVSAELGMSVAMGQDAIPLATRIDSSGLSYGPSYGISPWFHVTDASSEILGHYQSNNLKALATKKFGTYQVVFSGSPGLPKSWVRQLAVQAGVHFFTPSEGDSVEANGGALALHAQTGGSKNISLPYKVNNLILNTLAAPGDQVLCSNCDRATVSLDQGDTALLRWTGLGVGGAEENPKGNIIGEVQYATKQDDDSVVVGGWACTETYSPPLSVHMYVGGTYATGTFINGVSANLGSSSNSGTIGSRCKTSTPHGFEIKLSSTLARQQAGKIISVYAIAPDPTLPNPLLPNAAGVTVIPSSGGSGTGVSGGSGAQENPKGQILGGVETVSRQTDGSVLVSGWACTYSYSPALWVHMYAGGTYATGQFVDGVMANLNNASNTTAAGRCGTSTPHGFTLNIPPTLAQKHAGKMISIYAIAPDPTLPNPLLSNAVGASAFPSTSSGGGSGQGPAENPKGQILGGVEMVSRQTDGSVLVSGWTCTYSYSPALWVHMYAGGTYATGQFVDGVMANVNNASNVTASSRCGTTTPHGFELRLSSALAQKHSGKSISIYAIAPDPTLPNPLLPNVGVGNLP